LLIDFLDRFPHKAVRRLFSRRFGGLTGIEPKSIKKCGNGKR
jgi:hypothetical protein